MSDSLSFEDRFVGVGARGKRIFVRDYGSHHRRLMPLVCLSGFHRNSADFEFLAHALSTRKDAPRRILTIDFRGRGKSDFDGQVDDYSISQDIGDINQTLTALGISSAHVLGQSHGGIVAMGLAIARPTLFNSAILCDSGPEINGAGMLRLRRNLEFLLKANRWDDALQIFGDIQRNDYPNLSDERLDQLAERVISEGKNGRTEYLFDSKLAKTLSVYSLDDGFSTHWEMFNALNHVPLLVLKTELSDFITTKGYEAMLRKRADARGYVIPNQGSPALFEEAETLGVISAFLEKT